MQSDGTLFSSAQPGATFESVSWGEHRGFYGTWQLTEDTLALRTVHLPYDAACDEDAGRYRVTTGGDCETLQLQALDDACAERNALQALLEREP